MRGSRRGEVTSKKGVRMLQFMVDWGNRYKSHRGQKERVAGERGKGKFQN